MKITVMPGGPLHGLAAVPGDKSLSHRAVLFAALAEGESRIRNFLLSGVTRVMLDALTQMGVRWEITGDTLTVRGQGIKALRSPGQLVYCGNSATTIRLLAGAVSAAGVSAVLDGSPGLRRRPMDRIAGPLRSMGVLVDTGEGGCAPLSIKARPVGNRLSAREFDLPVASAQVKTCLLLAGLSADGPLVLREPGPSRDHTERMLRSMGVAVETRTVHCGANTIYETRLVPPTGPLSPLDMTLPGDFSAAAFLIVSAAITPGSSVQIPGIGINPTRTGLIDSLREMGAQIEVSNLSEQGGEPVGDLLVTGSHLAGGTVSGDRVVRMIDEFSVYGAAAAAAEGTTTVCEAAELRFKESDRISTLCQELAALGVSAIEAPDGFTITGGGLQGGVVRAHGDHRLAMAMAVAGLAARGPVSVMGAEIMNESFPGFSAVLRSLGANIIESGDEQ